MTTEFATSDEWFTPAPLVALVRSVMGAIDLDPASNAKANIVVQAAKYFTLEADGLAHEWRGRVYLNPPYSNVAPFVAKIHQEYDAGNVAEAIVLVNARTSSAWFQSLAARAWRCELRQRVRFWRPDRPEGSAGMQASVMFYVGPNGARFAEVFRPLGNVMASRNARPPCSVCSGPVAANRSPREGPEAATGLPGAPDHCHGRSRNAA